MQLSFLPPLWMLLRRPPAAVAYLQGSPAFPNIHGAVAFRQTPLGCLVSARVAGLPVGEGVCQQPVFGFHIHSGTSCSGNDTDPFADAMTHYNPQDCPHPYHAGDLPPLFGVNGGAYGAFLTGRFGVQEVLGRTVILHAQPDDFVTQPAGNAGMKIACGVIRPFFRAGAPR